MHAVRSLRSLSVRGKRVLYRAAYEVPLEKRGRGFVVADDLRIRETLPTLRYLLRQNARIVIASYLKRPGGKVVEKYRLAPVARTLSRLLKRPIQYTGELTGSSVTKRIAGLKPGQVFLLENTRFDAREDANDRSFAKELASYADVYVTDAFAQIHRKCASVATVPRLLPSAAGLLLEEEVATLEQLVRKPKRPYVAIIGGAKISSKLRLIATLLKQVDHLMLGGALANTLLKAKGYAVGESLIEPDMIAQVKSIAMTNPKLKLPVDVLVGRSVTKTASSHLRAIGNVKKHETILDIGPDTVHLFVSVLQKAKTIVWNGPVGYIENPAFAQGSTAIAKAVAASRGMSVVGGGETIQVINDVGVARKIGHISTGGGAMLDFFEGKPLPGLAAIGYSPLTKRS